MELAIRKQYVDEVNGLNSRVSNLLKLDPTFDNLFVATLPTLDNNVWTGDTSVAALLSRKIAKPHGIPRESMSQSLRLYIRYSIFTLLLETLLHIFSRSWKAHFPSEMAEAKLSSEILGFTFSDIDPLSPGFFRNSRFWGQLPSWDTGSTPITWIGFGSANNKSEHPFVGPRRLSGVIEPATRTYFKSLPSRMRLWIRMKRELSSIELFMVSKRQFRRSVLGPPALEALRLAHAFEDVILAYSPTAVLLPYENQLWQRVLAQLSQSRGIKVIGAVHSTARFWDLRLLRPQQFAEFFPTSYITNGPASETLLIGLGVPRSQLLQGTALRFSHLKANVTRELQLTSAGRILVVTGVNKTATARMITVIQQLTGLHSNDLTFRPHPAVTEWFRKKYPDLPIDDTDFSEAIRTYEAFICDSMSSLGFEFAACGKVVFVYKPEGELDFSPLKMVENFSSYFFHQKSFESIQHLPSRKFKLSEYLNVGGDRKIWSSLLRQIVD